MVVSLTWSSATSPGTVMTDPHNHGNITNNAWKRETIYLWHDGSNKITNCAWYIQPYTGTGYNGANGVVADYQEIVGWGDDYATASWDWTGSTYPTATGAGGFAINQNQSGTVTLPPHAAYDTGPLGSTNGDDDFIYTGHGTSDAPIELDSSNCAQLLTGAGAGTSVDGELLPTDEAVIEVLIHVPASGATSGIRFVDQCLRYSYTS